MDQIKPSVKKNPNKETIRRICTLYQCSYCLLLDDGRYPIGLLVNLKQQQINSFKQELESWTGYLFDIHNRNTSKKISAEFSLVGETLLPVRHNLPLEDIKRRSKFKRC